VTSSWLQKGICRQAKAKKLCGKVGPRLIKMDRGEPKARCSSYVGDCIVYESRSTGVQPASANKMLKDFRIGLD
jgi:ribosomal protein L35AE/L33A